jgi:hypothetical protein
MSERCDRRVESRAFAASGSQTLVLANDILRIMNTIAIRASPPSADNRPNSDSSGKRQCIARRVAEGPQADLPDGWGQQFSSRRAVTSQSGSQHWGVPAAALLPSTAARGAVSLRLGTCQLRWRSRSDYPRLLQTVAKTGTSLWRSCTGSARCWNDAPATFQPRSTLIAPARGAGCRAVQ